MGGPYCEDCSRYLTAQRPYSLCGRRVLGWACSAEAMVVKRMHAPLLDGDDMKRADKGKYKDLRIHENVHTNGWSTWEHTTVSPCTEKSENWKEEEFTCDYDFTKVVEDANEDSQAKKGEDLTRWLVKP